MKLVARNRVIRVVLAVCFKFKVVAATTRVLESLRYLLLFLFDVENIPYMDASKNRTRKRKTVSAVVTAGVATVGGYTLMLVPTFGSLLNSAN